MQNTQNVTYSPMVAVRAVSTYSDLLSARTAGEPVSDNELDTAFYAVVDHLHRARVIGYIERSKYNTTRAYDMLVALGMEHETARLKSKKLAGAVRGWFGV